MARAELPLNVFAEGPHQVVLSLGAGVQSSALLLMSCHGLLPRIDLAIFADTRYEPAAVYDHLGWLVDYAKRTAGIPVLTVSRGDLRQDALDFRRDMISADGKRRASIPVFVKNPDGSQGRVSRQCTKEYKIEPVEATIRTEVLKLLPRQHAPRQPVVEQWLGISSDEAQRMSYPGRYKSVPRKKTVPATLYDAERVEVVRERTWLPSRWKTHSYPFLGVHCWPDRSVSPARFGIAPMSRADCLGWLACYFPERKFPRSACICCPFRSNEEWRHMRDHAPADFADAVEFDRLMREREHEGHRAKRKPLTGAPYLHRQLLPLDQVDLDGAGTKGMGCGLLEEPEEKCGGLCDT